jgi:hypothetical protein
MNLGAEYVVYLKDNATGKRYNLTAGNAQVTLAAGVNYTQRFSIVFAHIPNENNDNTGAHDHLVDNGNNSLPEDSTATSIDEFNQVLMSYQLANQELFITNEAAHAGTVNLYNINGQVVETAAVGATSTIALSQWNSLAKGIYIIELTSANGHKATHKVAK